MKKFKYLLSAILVAALVITSVFAATGTITVAGARLREEANTESNILTKIYQGEQVEILEKNGDWYKVKYKSKSPELLGAFLRLFFKEFYDIFLIACDFALGVVWSATAFATELLI